MKAYMFALAACGASGSAGPYAIDWSSVDAGAAILQGTTYTLNGTIGQPDASPIVNGATYSVESGFWAGVVALSSACPADLDGNGTLNFDDIDLFIAGFLASDLIADLDGNGVLNFDDIDLFVTSFLAGCS